MAAGVDRQEHVGGAVGALGLHPRDQLVGVAFDPVHGDTGGFGEAGVELLVVVVMTRGIDVDLLRLPRRSVSRRQWPCPEGRQVCGSWKLSLVASGGIPD